MGNLDKNSGGFSPVLLGIYGDSKIYRGPRLESLKDFQELKARGIETVLNLERGYFEWFHGKLNQEVLQVSLAGMTPVHLQLGDVLPPSFEELVVALKIVRQAIDRGGVYIHCLHGVDRTGMVCAMVRTGLFKRSQDEAIAEMYSYGFHRFPYEALGWVKRLREVL